MLIHSSSHRHRAARKAWPWGLNRGDILLLACGVLAFLALTFLPGLLAGQSASPSPGGRNETLAAQAPSTAWPARALDPASASPDAGQPPAAPAPNFPRAAAPSRIVYPKASIDVEIHPLQPSAEDIASQAIEPPATMDGYWLALYGMPGAGSSNTTYVLGHSWEDRDAPFNHLSAAATPGDELAVATASGTMTYRVDSITTYLKSTLKDSPIWQAVPNRLVLISCYTEDPMGKNVVVVASPISSP
ncbi:class F sortase [Arthrobacter sp. CJ23]|uniref:class F sortase n=1 Tax=Arthrobacter sp. CJ23 TaxID=2972479 RepID=UPI00215CA9E5|nr:class F sortase [Arthrobacter sp. CJ23]UVJ40486.1 class F sortase [Arthrobacter sp. CJ23]